MGFVSKRRTNPLMASTRKILVISSLGVLLLVLAVLIQVLDPVLMIARFKTRVAPGSAVHELLQSELEAIHMSAYLFNVTNADRFLAGEDEKLKVQEVGPFTYRELRVNEDLELDMDAGVVRYSPRVTPVFSPEESVADPRDVNVTLPNIAMLTMVSMMSNYSFFSRMSFNMLLDQLGSKPIVSVSAQDYLWGYPDPLIRLGNTFMPGWISFDTMGLMDRLYDRKVSYRLEVGATNSDKFMIKKLNGCAGLRVWDYDDPDKRSDCNTFSDAYEGIAYPTDLSPSTRVRIFRNVLCRMLELEYQETRTLDYGPQALVYRISDDTWFGDKKNCTCGRAPAEGISDLSPCFYKYQETRTLDYGPQALVYRISDDTWFGDKKNCTCGKGTCVEGISDLSPCFYNLPLATSNAHFLHGGPELFTRIEGLQPDEEKHGSQFLIEPKIGAVLTTSFSIQVNIVIGDVHYNDKTKRFSDMVLPVGYFKIVQPELPEANKAEMRLLYVTGPVLALALQALAACAGLALLLLAARLLYWNWLCSDRRGIAFTTPDDGKKPSSPPAAGADLPLINIGS
ncbi:CD36 family domain-containing protein [Phthorimaea operculella]|nr:CD36 family domain-containing protein [Phthorimaea operculella]